MRAAIKGPERRELWRGVSGLCLVLSGTMLGEGLRSGGVVSSEGDGRRQGPSKPTIGLALLLLAVPTFFTVFPRVSVGHHDLRLLVFGC